MVPYLGKDDLAHGRFGKRDSPPPLNKSSKHIHKRPIQNVEYEEGTWKHNPRPLVDPLRDFLRSHRRPLLRHVLFLLIWQVNCGTSYIFLAVIIASGQKIVDALSCNRRNVRAGEALRKKHTSNKQQDVLRAPYMNSQVIVVTMRRIAFHVTIQARAAATLLQGVVRD